MRPAVRGPLDQVLPAQALEDREHRRVGPVRQLIGHFPAGLPLGLRVPKDIHHPPFQLS